MKARFLLIACVLLSACGSPVEGTYSDAMGLTSYTFKDDGKVYVSTMGTETELSYSVEDDKVTIGGPDTNVVLTLKDDGTLEGPLGMTLSRSKDE